MERQSGDGVPSDRAVSLVEWVPLRGIPRPVAGPFPLRLGAIPSCGPRLIPVSPLQPSSFVHHLSIIQLALSQPPVGLTCLRSPHPWSIIYLRAGWDNLLLIETKRKLVPLTTWSGFLDVSQLRTWTTSVILPLLPAPRHDTTPSISSNWGLCNLRDYQIRIIPSCSSYLLSRLRPDCHQFPTHYFSCVLALSSYRPWRFGARLKSAFTT